MNARPDLLSVCPIGVVALGPDGIVRSANKAFIEMTGIGGDALLGISEQQFNELLAERCEPGRPYRACEMGPGREFAQQSGIGPMLKVDATHCPQRRGPLCGCDLALVRPSKRHLRRTSAFLETDGERSRVLFFEDVTLAHTTESLKSEFIAAASHELRTPLTLINGYAEALLVEEHDVKTQLDMLRVIVRHGKNLARILDDMLDLARLEDRIAQTLPLASLDLSQFLLSACGDFEYAGDQRRPVLVVGSGPMSVLGDPILLGKCLQQLLSNAYRYSFRHGQITVAALAEQAGHPGWIGFSVSDEGIGMNGVEKQHVFDRFWRSDKSGKNLGTGLGMSLVNEIVTLHKGRIELWSEPGQGTRVSIWLPKQVAGGVA